MDRSAGARCGLVVGAESVRGPASGRCRLGNITAVRHDVSSLGLTAFLNYGYSVAEYGRDVKPMPKTRRYDRLDGRARTSSPRRRSGSREPGLVERAGGAAG